MFKEEGFDIQDWGGYARCYDALNSLRPYQELQKTVISRLGLVPGKKILDASCGTGNLVFWIQRGAGLNGAKVIGLDFSEEMLGAARRKCGGGAEFCRWDLDLHLLFADGCFDQVASINTFYALRYPASTLAEFYRVLKPGGTIVLVNPKKGYENGLILKAHCGDAGPDEPWLNAHVSLEKERELVSRAISDKETAARILSLAEYNRRIAANRKFHFPDEAALSAMFRKSGFKDVETGAVYAKQGVEVTARKGERHA